MGAKAKAKLDFNALKKLDGDPYAEFLKSIPPMVEEKQELKELKGTEIIEILKKQKAKKEEIGANNMALVLNNCILYRKNNFKWYWINTKMPTNIFGLRKSQKIWELGRTY